MLQQGTYNALIGQTNYYDSTLISFEDSHLAFKRSLGEGFVIQLIKWLKSTGRVKLQLMTNFKYKIYKFSMIQINYLLNSLKFHHLHLLLV